MVINLPLIQKMAIMSSNELYIGCPVQHARQFLSGKWQIGILWNLKEKPMRFKELKNILPGISDKVLTQELCFFETNGFINRKIFECVPSKVEYNLTPQGFSLIPIIENIIRWGYANLQEQKANRLMSSTPIGIIDEIKKLN